MNNSSDFMMFLHDDKVLRMREDKWIDGDHSQNRPVNRGVQSPFARVRSAFAQWTNGNKDRDLNQS